MARAQDLGSQYPGDAADSLPDDPTLSRAQVDYSIHSNLSVGRRSSSGGGGGISRIDIRTTPIIDSFTGRQSILSDLLQLSEISDEHKLGLRDEVYVADVNDLNNGKMIFRWSAPIGKYFPEAAFLNNEEDFE